MGTRGYRAYRYKHRYYRLYTNDSSYPRWGGKRFASLIPRDGATREVWIRHIIRGLEAGEAWRHQNNIKDDTEYLTQKCEDGLDVTAFQDEEPMFADITDDNKWMKGDLWIEWTYVIDLDCRAFTVNSVVHFNLDNMPPCPGIEVYFDGEDEVLIPQEYLTSVSYWPCPTSDLLASLDEYHALEPALVELEDWGVSSWSSLSVAQRLSVQLVKTLISDDGEVLRATESLSEHPKILLSLWQLACAAAPSHVLCPARATPRSENVAYVALEHDIHIRSGDYYLSLINKREVPLRINARDFLPSYYWFRGCLITFCTWLNEERHAKVEIGRMVKQLRKNSRTHGVGIVISTYQLVAIAVDGSEVRHSPVLRFHNGAGDVQDGLLLLMYLLSPALIVRKMPWASASSTPRYSPGLALPEEIIRHILCFTDDDTYHSVLPIVSRLVRSICLSRPRVGEFVLTATNSDGTYRALPVSGLATEVRANLTRIDDELDAALLCTFQHHQAGGVHPMATIDKPNHPLRLRHLSWNAMVKGQYQEMRVQVVEGKWGMVEVGAAPGDVPPT